MGQSFVGCRRALVLGPERFARLPAGRIDGQQLPVLPQHRQEVLVIMLVVAMDLGLGAEIVHLGPEVALQPAQEALDLLVLRL